MSKNSLKGKWGVVTGASGGIGYEFCRVLASMGCNLLMVAIEDRILEEAAEKIKTEFGVEAYPLTIDLTRQDSPVRILAYMETRNIVPYVLINNAGVFTFSPVIEHSEVKINRFIDLHVRAVTVLTREFADRMVKSGGGRILNMSSMSCWMPMPGIAMYTATKAYIRVISRAMHYELKDSGVTVTVACPGGIATDLFGLPENLRNFATGIGVLAKPEKFARKAVKRMLKGRKQYINGGLNRFAIFFVSILPTPVRMMVKRKMLDKGIRV